MLILGYLLAGLIGVSLGILGGGGSILTVPLLAYVIGLDAKVSIAAALPLVGVTSMVGAVQQWRHGHVRLGSALIFGSVAMAGAYAATYAARYISGAAQLALLAIVMLGSAWSMLRRRAADAEEQRPQAAHWGLMLPVAFAVGSLTGLVGAGGGFLVVPALVVLARVPMRQAVGTSLVVIAMNCASAFAGYAGKVHIPWTLIAGLTAVAVAGILLGSRVGRRLSAATLRRAFGWFLVAMSVFILYRSRDVFRNLGDSFGAPAVTTAR